MKKNRQSIQESMAKCILVESRFRCCICPEHRREVQIHHLNMDPSDNRYDNLVVVCCNCHADLHTKSSLYRNISAKDIRTMKKEWIDNCNAYDGFLRTCILKFRLFYFFNVPWIQRVLDELTGNPLFDSPIYALEAKNLFLFEKASSLNFRDSQLVISYLEKGIKQICNATQTTLLDDLIDGLTYEETYNQSIESDFILFNHDFYCSGLPKSINLVNSDYCEPALLNRKSIIDNKTFKIQMTFDPRFLVSITSFANIRGHGVRSGLGLFLGCTNDNDMKIIKIRPLAFGTSGPRLDEIGISGIYDEFKKYRDDILKYINDKKRGII